MSMEERLWALVSVRKSQPPFSSARLWRLAIAGSTLSSSCCSSVDSFPVHLQNVNVMGQAIQQSAGQPLRTQHFGPFDKRQIAGYQRGTSLISLAQNFEQL
jgi:hypothetical protein